MGIFDSRKDTDINPIFSNMDEMQKIASLFIASQNKVLSNYVGEDAEVITLELTELILTIQPHAVLTQSHIGNVVTLIFENERVRDYLFNLSFTFFGQVGNPKELSLYLADVIARSLDDNTPNEANLIPNEFKKRLTNYETALTLLSNNRWLLTFMLFLMFTNTKADD